ncbi:hypothetical protein Brsp01_46510 [Brucella sp. NBRC 12950]|nr:hypothetical protein Brsp01_46510 [Brucella sp. NBRC 12950]
MSNDTFGLPLVLFHWTKWCSPVVLSICNGGKKWRLGVKVDHKLKIDVTDREESKAVLLQWQIVVFVDYA